MDMAIVENDQVTCERCASTGTPRVVQPGHRLAGFALASLAFIGIACAIGNFPEHRLPGQGFNLGTVFLILLALAPHTAYSWWRYWSRRAVCACCGHPEVMPAASPRARELRRSVPERY